MMSHPFVFQFLLEPCAIGCLAQFYCTIVGCSSGYLDIKPFIVKSLALDALILYRCIMLPFCTFDLTVSMPGPPAQWLEI